MYGYTRSLGRIGDSSSWMIYVVHYHGNIHLCHDHWSFSSPAICSAEPPTVVVRHSLSETRLQAWLKLRRQAKLEREFFLLNLAIKLVLPVGWVGTKFHLEANYNSLLPKSKSKRQSVGCEWILKSVVLILIKLFLVIFSDFGRGQTKKHLFDTFCQFWSWRGLKCDPNQLLHGNIMGKVILGLKKIWTVPLILQFNIYVAKTIYALCP